MPVGVPGENAVQGEDGRGRRRVVRIVPGGRGAFRQRSGDGGGGGTTLRRGSGQRVEQVAHACRPGGRLIAEPLAEGSLDAARQLDPGKAVEAEIAIEGGIEPDRGGAAPRLELADHSLYDTEQSRRRIVGGPRIGVVPGHPSSALRISALKFRVVRNTMRR